MTTELHPSEMSPLAGIKKKMKNYATNGRERLIEAMVVLGSAAGWGYVITLKQVFLATRWGCSQWSSPDTARLTCSAGGGEGG